MVEIEIMGMVGGDVDLNWELAGSPRIIYVEELAVVISAFQETLRNYTKGVTRILYIIR
jgi:hypothetical protein